MGGKKVIFRDHMIQRISNRGFKMKNVFVQLPKGTTTYYQAIFSFLAEPRNFICCCAKEEEILLPNFLPDFNIGPI